MTSLTANAGQATSFSPPPRRIVSAALLRLRGMVAERRPEAPQPAQDWTTLNAHFLADIGETPENASAAAQRDPFWRPLGAMGSVFGGQPSSRL